MGLSVDDVAVALGGIGVEAGAIADLGAGPWSSCCGFATGGRDLVMRYGRHVEDFEKDRDAVRFSRNEIPIPVVEPIRPHRRLASLDTTDAPRSVIDADLVNRNVRVSGDRACDDDVSRTIRQSIAGRGSMPAAR